MQKTVQKSELVASFFPGGSWVFSGKNKEIVTSQSTGEVVQSFLAKNGIFPGAGKEWQGLKGSVKFDWTTQMLPPTEHKNEAGDLLFNDRGNRLTFDRVRVSDDEIRVVLVHAQQKFGLPLTLTGGNPVFTERMARLADDMGITILNPDMQPVIAAHRASLANQSSSFAPPMTIKKGRFWQRVLTFLGVKAKK